MYYHLSSVGAFGLMLHERRRWNGAHTFSYDTGFFPFPFCRLWIRSSSIRGRVTASSFRRWLPSSRSRPTVSYIIHFSLVICILFWFVFFAQRRATSKWMYIWNKQVGSSRNHKVPGSIPALPKVARRSALEQDTEPPALHCSPLLLHNQGWFKCREELSHGDKYKCTLLIINSTANYPGGYTSLFYINVHWTFCSFRVVKTKHDFVRALRNWCALITELGNFLNRTKKRCKSSC